MDKKAESWTVRRLREKYPSIDFPEYQREPNLWSLIEKQRLIDSMIRSFDIAALYLYQHDKDTFDCVDGRQRIGAISAFLGDNESDEHTNFLFKNLNEVYEDEGSFPSLVDKSFSEIEALSVQPGEAAAQRFLSALLDYKLTVVILSDSSRPEEFNLQFTRLNLGTIINSGEKLHAMVGELRNVCFERLGPHPFLTETNIPTRRYAREQVAAQILAQVFSLETTGTYTRTRHFDLQALFKRGSTLSDNQRELVAAVLQILDLLAEPFANLKALRNRAITVSLVLLARRAGLNSQGQAQDLANFTNEFVHHLNWQIKKGLEIDEEYRHLADFQRYVTQASAESSSTEMRTEFLGQEYGHWQETGRMRGDEAWQKRNPDSDPRKESGL